MSVILAIDAAWTTSQPSGVAVMVSHGKIWHCVGVAPSYEAFLELSGGVPVDWNARRFYGSVPEVTLLLDAASRLAGASVDVVTIDMPVATVPIIGRREADKVISRTYGGRGCPTHSPSSTRPGKLGESLTKQFKAVGYCIATNGEPAARTMRLVEVYPHPALLSLLKYEYRVRYKVAKSLSYWPETTIKQRIEALLEEFRVILQALVNAISPPVGFYLPSTENVPTLTALKRYEDAIDALVCAWMGIRYLEGSVSPFGDETAAIWCPNDDFTAGIS